MSSSDRRFRRAVGRVLIALSFKHSREHGGRGAGDAHLLPSPSCGGDGHHRPGAYCPSSPTAADHRQSSSPPSHYCAVVLPSPAHFIVRTALLLVFLPTALAGNVMRSVVSVHPFPLLLLNSGAALHYTARPVK